MLVQVPTTINILKISHAYYNSGVYLYYEFKSTLLSIKIHTKLHSVIPTQILSILCLVCLNGLYQKHKRNIK